MGIGVGIFLMAIGAILKFAVTGRFQGLDLGVMGVILMIVGTLGVFLSLLFWSSVAPFGGRRETVVADQPVHTHL
ncbi:MAG: DUF6458 family protein [Actinomycetota bacterium]